MSDICVNVSWSSDQTMGGPRAEGVRVCAVRRVETHGALPSAVARAMKGPRAKALPTSAMTPIAHSGQICEGPRGAPSSPIKTVIGPVPVHSTIAPVASRMVPRVTAKVWLVANNKTAKTTAMRGRKDRMALTLRPPLPKGKSQGMRRNVAGGAPHAASLWPA